MLAMTVVKLPASSRRAARADDEWQIAAASAFLVVVSRSAIKNVNQFHRLRCGLFSKMGEQRRAANNSRPDNAGQATQVYLIQVNEKPYAKCQRGHQPG
jgi:hypothetical protein